MAPISRSVQIFGCVVASTVVVFVETISAAELSLDRGCRGDRLREGEIPFSNL